MRSTAPTKPIADEAVRLTDQAAAAASHAIRSSQRAAGAAIDRWSDHADSALLRGVDAFSKATHQLRDSARRSSNAAALRVRDQPLQSVLIAAAAGAALMAIVGFVSRSRKSSMLRGGR